jgi:hypothetical protein
LDPGPYTLADFYQIPALTKRQIEFLGKKMVALNDVNRKRQKAVIDGVVRDFGIRCLPLVLGALEIGSANTQQGCLEILENLKEGSLLIEEREVSHRELLTAWYLARLEMGYRDLSDDMEIHDRKLEGKKMREVFREHLCQLLKGVADSRSVGRLLLSVQEEPSEIVRSAAYDACGELGASYRYLPWLIDVYQDETDVAGEFLWLALKKITGKNYPNQPRVWLAWLKRKGKTFE